MNKPDKPKKDLKIDGMEFNTAASTHDCTGGVPTGSPDGEDLDVYNDIIGFEPPKKDQKNSEFGKRNSEYLK